MKDFHHFKRFPLIFLIAGLLLSACVQPGGNGPGLSPDSNTALQSLSLSAGNLTPPFNAETTEYRVDVNNRVQTLTIQADPAGRNAVVSGTGTFSLDVGGRTIAITVKSEAGTRKTYVITVKRLDDMIVPISSPDELKRIGREEGYSLAGDYTLNGNLTLSNWTPIAPDTDHAFSGSFDGNSKTITLQSFDSTGVSNNTYLGIFGYVKGSDGSKAEITNVVINSEIDQESAATGGQAIGLLAGYTENTVIEDITLDGNFEFKSAKNIYVGGVVGYAQKRTTVMNSDTSMTMNIDGGNGNGLLSGMYYTFVGGVVGLFKDGVDIIDCHNTGDITADCTANDSQVFCGGIAGGSYYAFTTEYQGKIEDCSSAGNITAKCKGFWSWAGGIAGCIVGDGNGTLENTTRIIRCWASETVSVADSSAGFPYVGGIVGYNYYGALIAQSYFTGVVTANSGTDYTGGIAGYNSQYAGHNSRIEDCWSSGTVTGFSNAGGIVGQNQVNTYVRRCYSTAIVIATNTGTTGVGGIAGMNASILPDAITACVALNPSLKNGGSANIHRIVGNGTGTITNNHAWSGMPLTAGETPITPSDTGLNGKDGADCDAKPAQSVYEGLGWDFGTVWTMDGSTGYPVLRWQH